MMKPRKALVRLLDMCTDALTEDCRMGYAGYKGWFAAPERISCRVQTKGGGILYVDWNIDSHPQAEASDKRGNYLERLSNWLERTLAAQGNLGIYEQAQREAEQDYQEHEMQLMEEFCLMHL